MVLGLANAWAFNQKVVFFTPEEIKWAYDYLKALDKEPRGFMFWSIGNEGVYSNITESKVYLAKELNAFLHTREQNFLQNI